MTKLRLRIPVRDLAHIALEIRLVVDGQSRFADRFAEVVGRTLNTIIK